MRKCPLLAGALFFLSCLTIQAQSVSAVLNQSLITAAGGAPSVSGNTFSVFTTAAAANPANANFGTIVTTGSNYSPANSLSNQPLTSALAQSISVALSLIPVSSPSSGIILKKDPATGADLPVSATLGPIFTQRAESIGKGNFYIGITHQGFHFTSFNGQSLNGLSILYPGGDPSGVINPNTGASSKTAPTTFNMGLDVRLSQDIAFLTYGLTNKLDVSVGLPEVHAAVATTSYNGISYSGTGTDFNAGNQCWCINTFTPGVMNLAAPYIGSAHAEKTGFGDLIIRAKDTLVERPGLALAVGLDLRLPTGDKANFLGTGATLIKPFAALSLYSRSYKSLVFAPHFEVGFQGAVATDSTAAVNNLAKLQDGTPVLVAQGYTSGFVPSCIYVGCRYGDRYWKAKYRSSWT